MAEIATIARPYAEALFQVAKSQDLAAWGQQLDALAQVAQDADLRQFADHPKASAQQVFDVMAAAAKTALAPGVQNFLRTVIENGRLAALPAIVAQYHPWPMRLRACPMRRSSAPSRSRPSNWLNSRARLRSALAASWTLTFSWSRA